MRLIPKEQLGDGPWWIVGTFDAEWKVLSVKPAVIPGEALVDQGQIKVMRLVDRPFHDWREVHLYAGALRRAYAGNTPGFLEGKRQDVRKARALHVDRNPPNSPNRYLP